MNIFGNLIANLLNIYFKLHYMTTIGTSIKKTRNIWYCKYILLCQNNWYFLVDDD